MKSIMVKSSEKTVSCEKNYSLKVFFSKAIYFSLGLLISRGSILGSYYPFGMSFFAAASSYEFLPTLLGVLLGYLLPLRLGSGIRYISTIISIMAIKWALGDLNKIKNHKLYIPLVVFFSSFTTGLAMNCADGISFHSVMITLLECLVASSISYFFDVSFKTFSNKKFYNLNSEEFVCIIISLSIPLISLSDIAVHGVSLGRILGILVTLISAYSLNIIGGSIVGATSGVIFSLSSFGMPYYSASYAFAGMIAGKCSSLGKWGVCMAFTFVHALISFRSGDAFQMISGLYETIVADILLFILPESFINNFKNLFSSLIYVDKEQIPHALIQRLRLISNCFASSLSCLDKVNLEVHSKINLEEACFDSVKLYCSNCGIKKLCWENNRRSTYDDIRSVIKEISSCKDADKIDFSPNILKSCNKSKDVIKRIYDVQKDFLTYHQIKAETQEFKNVAQNHFEELKLLIDDISLDLISNDLYNNKLSGQIEKIISKKDIEVKSISCRENKEKKIFIKIETSIIDKNKFDLELIKEISQATGRKFEKPIINMMNSSCIIQLFEIREYKVNFSMSQHACNGGKFCGDSCRNFEDGYGNFNIVLSDGMGTGSSAAIEGSIVSEFIKSFIKFGLDFTSAIKLVNSIMLLNTKEEALTSLDLLSIDLFKGEVKFIKAGSPATFIIRGSDIEKVDFTSLPIGILKKVSFSYKIKEVKPGDIILMFSDGVTDLGDEWIINLIKGMKENDISEISKYIVREAVKERSTARDDDITAIAVEIIKKA